MKNSYLLTTALLLALTVSCCKNKPDDTPDAITYQDKPYVQTTPWPRWIFQHWVWEDEGTAESAKQLVLDYRAHGIPVDAIIIDSPWETGYNTFVWDNNLYPDAQGMINWFHDRNVRVVVWATGVINTNVQPHYDYAVNNNYFMKGSAGGNAAVVSWWKGDGSLIDWYNPDAVNWWKGLMDSTLQYGIDGWKCDGTDFYSTQASYSPGAAATVDRLDYSHHYYQLFHDYTRQKLGNDRVVFSRPIDNYGILDIGGDFVAFSPKEIGWQCWVGDQDATFDGLKKALNNMYHSDDYGYLSFGSDIGGYREDDNYPATGRSKELFIRWAQLGAFSPIMENGGGGEHRPWMFDDETTAIYARLVLLREKMIDYLMATAESSWSQGISMMRFFNKTDYSYLLGNDIFVTPVISAGGLVQVNFPAGNNWVYLYDNTVVHTGGSSTYVSVPLDEYPVFIRQGSELLNVLEP